MFDLVDLRAFARIADLGSISGAARALRMPKSSVSRSLVRLEEAVGAVLVERSTRHLRLTDAGLLLKRHARRIIDDVGEAENAITGLVGAPRGDLRVSVPFTFATGPLAPMLPAFLLRYPEVRVVLSIDNRPIDLLVEEADIAIRIGPLPDSSLIARSPRDVRVMALRQSCLSGGRTRDRGARRSFGASVDRSCRSPPALGVPHCQRRCARHRVRSWHRRSRTPTSFARCCWETPGLACCRISMRRTTSRPVG